MSKLDRKNHKVFGINATETKVGQFGSANATAKITTKDVEKIQALDAWEQGWEAGAVGNNRYPTQQERTGVDYEHSYQIGYMLQEGVPEWNKDTTYNKGSIVKAYNGTTLQNYVSLVDDNLNNAVTDTAKWKSGLANSDLSNLTETGEKHFINKSQITNCLLEVPQRVKYKWKNNVLTFLKGTTIIVPWGTEDKTVEYPIGSTFQNDNLKVVDTQFDDGKFFVWAEIQNDMQSYSWVNANMNVTNIFNLTNGTFSGHPIAQISSGTTAPTATSSQLWYDTTNNYIREYANASPTGKLTSLPLLEGMSAANDTWSILSLINNGMIRFASTLFIDKGIKGLIPNGINNDGTLNNIEYTSDKLILNTFTSSTPQFEDITYAPYEEGAKMLFTTPKTFIDDQNNLLSSYGNVLSIYKGLSIGMMNRVANGKINSLCPNKIFSPSNKGESKWNCTVLKLAENAQGLANKTYIYDLRNYLPSNSNVYEVMVAVRFYSLSNNLNVVLDVTVSSDFIVNLPIARVKSLTSHPNDTSNCMIIPIGLSRTISFQIGNVATETNGMNIFLYGYRRL